MLTRILVIVVLAATLAGLRMPALAAAASTPAVAASDHALLLQLAAKVQADDVRFAADDARLARLQELLAAVRAAAAPAAGLTAYGPFTVTGKDVYLDGYNLHIRSGSGTTDGAVNGAGNLIIGYDETGSGASTRTGSHNLVLGMQNNYSSYGSIVGGLENNAYGPETTVMGGRRNTARAHGAVIVGGEDNNSNGVYSVVGGGKSSTTSTEAAFLPVDAEIANLQTQVTSDTSADNSQNASIASLKGSVGSIQSTLAPVTTTRITTQGPDGSSSSGYLVTFTAANLQVVNGTGSTQTADGLGNLIVGYNEARGSGSDTRTGSHDIIAGEEENYSSYGGIVTGFGNATIGSNSSVVGGVSNIASGAGSLVVGGALNQAEGADSLAGGSYQATASGEYSTALGCATGTASGYSSALFGGFGNAADNRYSAVTGGEDNAASGMYSAVSGGYSETEANDQYWKGGTYESK